MVNIIGWALGGGAGGGGGASKNESLVTKENDAEMPLAVGRHWKLADDIISSSHSAPRSSSLSLVVREQPRQQPPRPDAASDRPFAHNLRSKTWHFIELLFPSPQRPPLSTMPAAALTSRSRYKRLYCEQYLLIPGPRNYPPPSTIGKARWACITRSTRTLRRVRGHLAVLRFLTEQGVSLFARDHWGNTPLDTPCAKGTRRPWTRCTAGSTGRNKRNK